jgi:hypothetical protein
VVTALLAATVLAACGAGGPPAPAPSSDRPLSQVSQSAPPPVSTRPPGPVITSGCQELSAAQVAVALGVPAVTAKAGYSLDDPSGTSVRSCDYLGGGPHAELMIDTRPATRTPRQAISLALRQYSGTLASIPGLGDAAYYVGPAQPTTGLTAQVLVTAVAEGSQLRTVTIFAFCKDGVQAQLTSLARAVLARV